MKDIANRIKNLRKEKHLKQWQIAGYLDISQQSYSYYEQNKRELPVRHIIKIAEFYNVSTDYILGIAPRRAGNFDLDSYYLQDFTMKDVVADLSSLNPNNRQELLRFLYYLNHTRNNSYHLIPGRNRNHVQNSSRSIRQKK